MSKLTVHNAEITTASVEVKTLTISGKQVTLAVFRQLREEPLIAEDGTLNGLPWGTVNYHPDKCGSDAAHVHVVWQKGAELLRCNVKQSAWTKEFFFSEEADDAIQATYCLLDHIYPSWVRKSRRPSVFDQNRFDPMIEFRIKDVWCETACVPDYFHEDPATCMTQAQHDDFWARLRLDVAAEVERRAHRDARWQEISDLPQLFIAV